MNIHRDPLCGRNLNIFGRSRAFGVYGERGCQRFAKQGRIGVSEAFRVQQSGNETEENDSRVSERALREIYLKGFEICVKTADPKMIMTSYNKINGVYSCYNFDLCTEVLRNEWGFTGAVTTDWWNVPETIPTTPA